MSSTTCSQRPIFLTGALVLLVGLGLTGAALAYPGAAQQPSNCPMLKAHPALGCGGACPVKTGRTSTVKRT